MNRLSTNLLSPDSVGSFYEHLTSAPEEPFDAVFTFLQLLYFAANRSGQRVMLDGAGGDIVMHEGSYIVRLIRAGHWRLALHEILAESRTQGWVSPHANLFRYARSAMLPRSIARYIAAVRYRRRYSGYVESSPIDKGFAKRVGMPDRIETMRKLFQADRPVEYVEEYCRRILPNMTAGKERYARIAAAAGMEARDPYMDRRVVEYCARLPARFKLRDGWPKVLLREINVGTLPDEVLWTPRKPHIGSLFLDEVSRLATAREDLTLPYLQEQLASYIDPARLAAAWQNHLDGVDSNLINNGRILASWLTANAQRPVVSAHQIL